MKPSLHLITDHRSRRRRGRHRVAVRVRGAIETSATPLPERQAQPQPQGETRPALPAPDHHTDIDAMRVREAGGPLDYASYGCECGYQFTAPVSSSVGCPHCGASQAW